MTRCVSEFVPEEWDGYVNSHIKDQMLSELDAYGKLIFMVGFNDEWAEDPRCECEKPDICDGLVPLCKTCDKPEHRGDWMACFDFKCYTDPDGVTHTAYHVVVNSDSGGFIETIDQGVVSEAPFNLPNYWSVAGMKDSPWTVDELEAVSVCQRDWERDLKAAIIQSKIEQLGEDYES